MAIRYVIRREKNAQDMLHYGIFTLMFTLKTFKSCSKKIQFCLVCFFSSRPLAEYSSWMFLTTKHPYRVNKFIINWFADKKKKIYWETKHSEGHFLPWVPLCEQHAYEQLFQPLSPSAANLTRRQFCDDLKFIFVESRHNFLSATNNKRLLFELVKSNLTHNNGPFLDTVMD